MSASSPSLRRILCPGELARGCNVESMAEAGQSRPPRVQRGKLCAPGFGEALCEPSPGPGCGETRLLDGGGKGDL